MNAMQDKQPTTERTITGYGTMCALYLRCGRGGDAQGELTKLLTLVGVNQGAGQEVVS